MENKKEKYFASSLEPISLKQTEKIIEQMKSNGICKINNKGIGFFVKIPYKSKLLPVLITTYKVINIADIIFNKTILLYLNNDKNIKSIKLDNSRLIYTNKKFDITIIEIKENKDNLKIKYLELDDEIINYFKLSKIKLNKNEYQNYLNESIYLLHYHDNKDIFISYGKLLDINNTEIIHKCIIKNSSSGAPIFLTKNQKLIGIHTDNSKHYKYNKGTLLIYYIYLFRLQL